MSLTGNLNIIHNRKIEILYKKVHHTNIIIYKWQKFPSVGMGAAKSNETRYIGMVMSVNSGT